jgi:N-succinyl-L-ornithine transcarbamylase
MKQFTSVKDAGDIEALLHSAKTAKSQPQAFQELGRNKTLGLVFMNPSFRTRLSTQKAAHNLGMSVIALNINQEGWKLEMENGAVMNGDSVEHVKDAAAIMGIYCDVVGLRCFPGLRSREEDYSEQVLHKFIQYCKCPFISLESATLHPLQSLADMLTMRENWHETRKPKVVMTWAPHIKPLPQAVPNSFSEWVSSMNDIDFIISHPEGYELCENFTKGAQIIHKQEEALQEADFIYAKNWSSYTYYGTMPEVKGDWLLTDQKLATTNNAKVMHCLPVRRNVEVPDHILDGANSLILQQAKNRTYAAQAVLKQLLEDNF